MALGRKKTELRLQLEQYFTTGWQDGDWLEIPYVNNAQLNRVRSMVYSLKPTMPAAVDAIVTVDTHNSKKVILVH